MSSVLKLPNNLTSFISITGTVIIIWVYASFAQGALIPKFNNPIFSQLAQLLTLWNLNSTIAFALVLTNAMVLSSLLSRYNLFNVNSYIAGIVYALALSCHPAYIGFHPALIVNIFILLILDKIFSSYRQPNVLLNYYEAGLLVGVSALMYLPCVVLMPFVFAANAIVRPIEWREWITQALGIITPFYILAAGFYFFMGWEALAQLSLGFFLPLYSHSNIQPFPYPLWICLGIMLIWGIQPIINELQSRAVRGKKLYSIMGWLGVFCIVSMLIFDPAYTYSIPLILIPLSVYIAIVIKREDRLWVKGVIFFSIICVIVYSHIVTLHGSF